MAFDLAEFLKALEEYTGIDSPPDSQASLGANTASPLLMERASASPARRSSNDSDGDTKGLVAASDSAEAQACRTPRTPRSSHPIFVGVEKERIAHVSLLTQVKKQVAKNILREIVALKVSMGSHVSDSLMLKKIFDLLTREYRNLLREHFAKRGVDRLGKLIPLIRKALEAICAQINAAAKQDFQESMQEKKAIFFKRHFTEFLQALYELNSSASACPKDFDCYRASLLRLSSAIGRLRDVTNMDVLLSDETFMTCMRIAANGSIFPGEKSPVFSAMLQSKDERYAYFSGKFVDMVAKAEHMLKTLQECLLGPTLITLASDDEILQFERSSVALRTS